MKKVYSLIYKLHEVSGVQKVLLDVHNGIKKYYSAQIASYLPYKSFSKYINVPEKEYKQIKSIIELKRSVVITHERISCTKCVIYNKIFHLKIKQIHVQHSIYESLRFVSLFPENVVSISDKVTQNLIGYFKLPLQNIHKIHNGVVDEWSEETLFKSKDNYIHIAYVARVDSLKNQVQIVEHLKDTLSKRVIIDFIGNGPLFDKLSQISNNQKQFNALGYKSDIIEILRNYDYLMLFSEKEGLPITLIEGAMCCKPLIINDIGGCLEIGVPMQNALIANNWQELETVLNSLEDVTDDEYIRMAQNSRKIYNNKFRYNTMILKYVNLINSVF